MDYFDHIIRHITLQPALLYGKIEGRRSQDRQMTKWMGGTTDGDDWVMCWQQTQLFIHELLGKAIASEPAVDGT